MRMTLKKLNDLAPIGKTETECHSYRNYKGHLIVERSRKVKRYQTPFNVTTFSPTYWQTEDLTDPSHEKDVVFYSLNEVIEYIDIHEKEKQQ